MNNRSAWVAAVLLMAFAAWAVAGALTTDGFLEADEVAHFLYARHAPAQPMNLLYPWARPLYTLLLMPFAQLGIPAARLLAALSAAVAALFAFLACRAFGWRTAACAIPMTFVQPIFFQQTCGLWTELLFSALLGAWIFAIASNRPILSAVVAALLPLVRPEGLVVAAAAAIALLARCLRDREWKPARFAPLAILPSGVLLWGLLGYAASGDPLWLPRHWPPNWAPSTGYGHGSWSWIVDAFPNVVPRVLVPLLVLGLVAPRMRQGWPIALAAALVVAVHAVLWKLGSFGSAGYPRYFVTLAPAFAVLIAGGIEILARILRPVPTEAWVVLAAAAAVFLLFRHPTATLRPLLPPDARLFAALGKWIRTQDPRPVLFSAHPFAYLELDSVPADRFEDLGHVTAESLRSAPTGAWVLVEDRFYLPGNPGEPELGRLGFERMQVPDLGVDLAVVDARQDRALEHMYWALYRKGGR